MIGQLNIYGNDKVEQSIERIKMFEPEEGYYLAFSGGKDSVVIKALADMAGVKYDAHYNRTTVDPPELIYFIREHHKDVIIHRPQKTMWQLIPHKKIPPTRKARYCCEILKEGGGESRFVITGVRWAESSRRKNSRAGLEQAGRNRIGTDPDNPDTAKLTEICQAKSKRILNPIIDWTDEDVWEFIKACRIPYCKLYDEGFKRLGCIGCNLAGKKQMEKEFKLYPKFKQAYIRAFDRMIQERLKSGLETKWKTGEEVMEWWIGG